MYNEYSLRVSHMTMGAGRTSMSSMSSGRPQLPHCLRIGGGDAGQILRSYNWSQTPLGSIKHWPENLRDSVGLILHSAFPMFLWWGRELITIHNDACAPTFGKKFSTAMAASARELCADVWPAVGPLVEQVFSTGKPIACKDLQLNTDRNGYQEEVFCTLSLSPIFNTNGSIDGIFCTFNETTDDVRYQQSLVALNSAKDEFISLASHQLRTPATGVKQYLGMLIGDFAGKLTDQQKELAQHAYDSNERQLTVVSDLLSTAQADSGRFKLHKQPVDIITLVNDVLEEQASKFEERGQRIEFKFDKQPCLVSIDQDRMRMVLDNLVDNASKYTKSGNNKHITVYLQRNDREVTISIRDQGVGISKKDINTIFDKFIRVQNALSQSVGGNGLGLYLARKIVELHGGNLSVSSILSKGSTFTIALPV